MNYIWNQDGLCRRLVSQPLLQAYQEECANRDPDDVTSPSPCPPAPAMLAIIAKISPQDYWLQPDVNWKGFRPSKFEDIKLSCTIQAPSDADFPELDRHFTLGMANLRVLLNQCYNPKISKHEGVQG